MSKGTTVVTGAANGNGQADAQRLAADGVDIAVVDVAKAATTRAQADGTGRHFFSVIFDHLPKQQAIPRVIEPTDLVGVVSFLCSPDAAFVTGQTLVADGGQVRN